MNEKNEYLTEWTKTIVDSYDNCFCVARKDRSIECCTCTHIVSITMNKQKDRKTFYKNKRQRNENLCDIDIEYHSIVVVYFLIEMS